MGAYAAAVASAQTMQRATRCVMSRIFVIHGWMLALLAGALLFGGCNKTSEKSVVSPERAAVANYLLQSAPPSYDVPIGINIDNRVRVLGMDYSPSPIERGKPVTITFYFEALRDAPGDHLFFGHLEPVNEKPYRVKLDHPILNGRFPMNLWRTGDIIKDVFTITLPEDFPDTTGRVYAGFYRGNHRLQAYGPDKQKMDRQGRVVFGDLKIEELVGLKTEAVAFKVETPPKIDGILDEEVWRQAPILGPFVTAAGELASPRTTVRVLQNLEYFFVAFECEDTEMVATNRERDGDMRRDDRVGVLLDANGNRASFNAIWVNPYGAMSDSFFPVGDSRRPGDIEERDWDSGVEYAVQVRGSINSPQGADIGWTVEMAIPIKRLSDYTPPNLPDFTFFLANFVRVDVNHQGRERLSMWAPTIVEDAYRLEMLGHLHVVPHLVSDPLRGSERRPSPVLRDSEPPLTVSP